MGHWANVLLLAAILCSYAGSILIKLYKIYNFNFVFSSKALYKLPGIKEWQPEQMWHSRRYRIRRRSV